MFLQHFGEIVIEHLGAEKATTSDF
jgi:hypothetical protein